VRLPFAIATALAVLPCAARAELTLDACRATARRDHPDVAFARARAAAAEARTALAASSFLPALSVDGSFTASQGSGSGVSRTPTAGTAAAGGGQAGASGFFAPADFELWSANLTARQTIWDFGRTLNATQAARAGERSATWEARAALERADVEAEAAFRTALAADDLVAAARDDRDRAAGHLERARARVELGLKPLYEQRRAEVEAANAELALVAAQNVRDLARSRLGFACGIPALSPAEALVAPPPRESFELPAVDAAFDEAWSRLPEARAAREDFEAAEQGVDAARSTFFPNLSAVGTAGYRGADLDELNPAWTAAVQVSVPIVTGGAELARLREANAGLDAARASLESTRRALRVEVESGLLAVGEARARQEATARLLASAEEGFRLAQARWETGAGDALELADAQAQLAAARADRVRAGLDLAVALARIERLLGRSRVP
jgi:outer membrane protein TolC